MAHRFLIAAGVVAAAVTGILFMSQKEVRAADGQTDFTHTCSQPTQNGTDTVTVKVKHNGVTTSTPVDVTVLATDTPSEKAEKYKDAINTIANVTASHAAGSDTVTIAGSAPAVQGDHNEVTDVHVKRKNGLTSSGQKRHKTESADTSAGAYFEVSGTATGASLDADDPIVQVGTGRGMASVTTTAGMTATQIRNALLTALQTLGVNASAHGTTGIDITMGSADSDRLIWGFSDSGVETVGELWTE
jgi:hypothetical protein